MKPQNNSGNRRDSWCVARIEQALEDSGRFGLEAVARKPESDQRVVVRPH